MRARTLPTILSCAALLLASCGSSESPLTPTPGEQVETTTMTITSFGLTPRHIIVPRGSRVTVINDDRRNHNMASTPHPAHTDCPELNEVGFLTPGQRRQTAALDRQGLCAFHDHDLDENQAFQGTITIE